MVKKRYSPKERAKILRSVAAYNKANGRGGVAHAVKKYKVTFLTLSRWLKKTNAKITSGKKASKKKSRVKASSGLLGKSLTQSLSKIGKLEKEISQRQALIQMEKRKIKKLLA